MQPYADTNLLCQLYLALADAAKADLLIQQAKRHDALPLPATWLLHLELVNAFEYFVFLSRSGKGPRISSEFALFVQPLFEEDLREETMVAVTELPLASLMDRFRELSFRHTAWHGFRTYDIIHVASALVLGCDTFWSFDERACRLAKLEGLTVN